MDKQYSVWLTMVFGAGSKTVTALLSRFGSAKEVYLAFRENRALAGREAAEKAAEVDISEAEETRKALEERGVHIITPDDIYYPKQLKNMDDPPHVLFALGNYRILSGRLLSTTGSRDITGYTVAAQEALCGALCRRYTFVSTLSYGCDELTCLCAVKNRRGCVEMLAGGFSHEYPEGSRVLRELILRGGGCIITEYLPDTRPVLGNFKRRARVIAGISRALIVFQAGTKSGALAAAKHSGSVFFLPPHDVFARQYAGTAAYVRAGASLLFGAEDLLPVYDGEYRPTKLDIKPVTEKAPEAKAPEAENKSPAPESFDSELHEAVYKFIAGSSEPPAFDMIFREVSCDIAELSEVLLDLELEGAVRAIAGNRYAVGG